MRLLYDELGNNFIIECIKLYFSNWGAVFLGILYIVSMLYMLSVWKREGNFVVGVNVIWGIIILNPLFIYVMCAVGMDSRYYRMFWVFPLTVTVSIMIVCIMQSHKKQVKILLFIVLLALCINRRNESVFGRLENIQIWDNLYKVPNDILEISEILENSKTGEKIVLYPYMLDYLGMREYNPTIIPFAALYVQEGWLGEEQVTEKQLAGHIIHERWERVLVLAAYTDLDISSGDLLTAIQKCKVEYYVLDRNSAHYQLFSEVGCKVVGENEHYGILIYE